MSAKAIELPLFPLNLVLFPGMVLPLHIFEPRYRQMIADCQEQERPFGIVLVKPDSQPFEDMAEPADALMASAKQAQSLFSTYLEMLLKAANETEHNISSYLPNPPEALSHFIAYFLDIQDEQKQHLLELTSTTQRLQEEITILRREVPFMRQMLSQ